MKNLSTPVETSGTLDVSGARRVGLDKERIGMLMGLLIDQYTRKHLAVLREYFCNAWDAHVDAGHTHLPVLVTLPSDMQPSLIIQDFGTGLSGNDMFYTFGTYGASTKTNSDQTTGGMGIGSKSAWTLGQQFIVTSVKDGLKNTALFALDDEGYGTCDIRHSDVPTDEPNGTTISLAVPDVEAMHEDAQFFFETVDRGLVLVNGEEPTPVWETARQINDSTWIRPDHDGKIYLVQGQVPYVVDEEIFRQVNKRISALTEEKNDLAANLAMWSQVSDGTTIYFKAPIDTVNHHPSRERLRDTNLTVNALASLVLGLSQDLTTKVQEEVDAAASFFEANRILTKAVADLGAFKVSRKSVTYKGQALKRTAKIDLPVSFLTTKSWRATTKIVGTDHCGKTIEITDVDNVLVITEVPKGDEGKVTRYLKRFLEERTEYKSVFISDAPWGVFDWFAFGTESGAPTMTLTEFKAELRTMRDTNPRTRTEPSYTTGFVKASRDLDDRDLLTDIISWGKDIVVFHDSASSRDTVARAALADYTPVVLLGTQSLSALVKRVEEDGTIKVHIEWKPLVVAYAAEQFKSVTDDERAALGAVRWLSDYRYAAQAWTGLWGNLGGPEAVTHPVFEEVADAVALAELVAADITEERQRMLNNVSHWVGEAVDIPTFDVEIPEVDKVFPLLANVGRYALRNNEALIADAREYVNSKA